MYRTAGDPLAVRIILVLGWTGTRSLRDLPSSYLQFTMLWVVKLIL